MIFYRQQVFFIMFAFFVLTLGAFSQSQCPPLEQRDIYSIHYIDGNQKNGYYFPAKVIRLTDTLNPWTLYEFRKGSCRPVTGISFNHIFDYRVFGDSSVVIVGTRAFKKRIKSEQKDSAGIYAYFLFPRDSSKNWVISIRDLHYYKFDENGMIGITTQATTPVTYYLSAGGRPSLTTLNGVPLGGYHLYPSQASGAFMIRDTVTGAFSLAKLNGADLRALDSGRSVLFTQHGHHYLAGHDSGYKYHDIKRNSEQQTQEFSHGFPFAPGSTVAAARQGSKWFLVDSTTLSSTSVPWPDSLGNILHLDVIPYSKNILIKAKNGADTLFWWRSAKAGANAFVKTPIPGHAKVFPAFGEYVLYSTEKDTPLQLRNLASLGQSLELEILADFQLKASWFSPAININRTIRRKGRTNSDSASNPYTGKAWFRGQYKAKDGSTTGCIFYIDLLTNTLIKSDLYVPRTEYISLDRFFVFRDPGNKFFFVRDLEKLFRGDDSLIVKRSDSIIIVKPFIRIDGELRAKAITAKADCEDCTVMISPASASAVSYPNRKNKWKR